jgi:hypothetical protein
LAVLTSSCAGVSHSNPSLLASATLPAALVLPPPLLLPPLPLRLLPGLRVT